MSSHTQTKQTPEEIINDLTKEVALIGDREDLTPYEELTKELLENIQDIDKLLKGGI